MADLPIIFSAPMVRALLEGRKGQTRRIARITAIMGNKVPVTAPEESLIELEAGEFRRGLFHYASTGALSGPYRLPYAVGDRLYVRENWQALSHGDYLPTKAAPPYCDIRYAATDPLADLGADTRGYPWRPCIHMPRWASRLTLTVTDVRVQRLQDISEADAVAEGVDAVTMADVPRQAAMSRRSDFAALWNSLHPAIIRRSPGTSKSNPAAWDVNPWVAAYSFTVQRGNIDQIGGAE